jgi:hypothetical protein
VAGLVDAEVEHDPATGLPFLRGRSIKGLLTEECDHLMFALRTMKTPASKAAIQKLEEAGRFLYGTPGSEDGTAALMRVGSARLPKPLREAIHADVQADRLTPAGVLDALTTIRRQTAVDDGRGAPETGSLRAMRVVLRETTLEADLYFGEDPTPDALALLDACVRALRRVGTGRNRGRGRVEAVLCQDGKPVGSDPFAHFKTIILATS